MTEDLTTWLLQQIAEDERIAGPLPADGYPKHDSRVLSVKGTMDVPWPDRWNPVIVLAECDAKRRLLRLAERMDREAQEQARSDGQPMPEFIGDTRAREIRQTVALPYADRPGFRKEWRPS